MSNVRVVAFSEQLDDSRDLSVVSKQHETEGSDSGSSDIVIDVGYSKVEQLLDHLVASGTGVRESDRKHTTVSKDSVLRRSADISWSTIQRLCTYLVVGELGD